jgi:hypothetical protein
MTNKDKLREWKSKEKIYNLIAVLIPIIIVGLIFWSSVK